MSNILFIETFHFCTIVEDPSDVQVNLEGVNIGKLIRKTQQNVASSHTSNKHNTNIGNRKSNYLFH